MVFAKPKHMCCEAQISNDMKGKLPFHKIENFYIFSFLAQEAQKHDWRRKYRRVWQEISQKYTLHNSQSSELSSWTWIRIVRIRLDQIFQCKITSKNLQLDSQLGAFSLKTSSRNFRWEVALREATTCVYSRAQQQRRRSSSQVMQDQNKLLPEFLNCRPVASYHQSCHCNVWSQVIKCVPQST